MAIPAVQITSHLVVIFFFYGLAFFVTGLVVWLEAGRASALPLARVLPFLAAFGIVHGAHEWFEMFQLMSGSEMSGPGRIVRLLVLVLSFALLAEFGLRALALGGRRYPRLIRWALLALWLVGTGLIWARWRTQDASWISAADAWCRYSLAVPGAVLAAGGLFKQSRSLAQQPGAANALAVVGAAFLVYGIPGQIFVGSSPLPPSTVLNTELFLQAFHFPVQLLRTVMASLVAVFTVRGLWHLELGRQRQMEELNRARLEAQRRLTEEMAEREALRRELLRQTVQAQEEERTHIARELHDETGQALTALSWGLTAVEKALPAGSEEVRRQVGQLRQVTDQVMVTLRRLTARLRPPVLDELGLVAALITYVDDWSARFPFLAEVEVCGRSRRLPSEVETTLYRITQEALVNVAKHAQASRAHVRLTFDEDEATLSVADDGVGTDVDAAWRAAVEGTGWGLAGIRERIRLVGGRVHLHSSPGQGTELLVRVPISPAPSKTQDEEEA